MRPTSREVLAGVSEGLETEVLPALTDPLLQGKVGLMTYLLRQVASGCDDEGVRLHESIARDESVLERAASLIAQRSPELAERSRAIVGAQGEEGGRAELRARENVLGAVITEVVVLCEMADDEGLAGLRADLYAAVIGE